MPRFYSIADALFYIPDRRFSVSTVFVSDYSIFTVSRRPWLDLFVRFLDVTAGDVGQRCDNLSYVVRVHRQQQFTSKV